MTLFLILAPFGAFASLMLVASPALSLFVAAAIALAVIAWDVFRGNSVKILMASSMVLFGALGCYDIASNGAWSTVAVRLAVDGGVLAIALTSIVIRIPFTVQYAREKVDAETLRQPHFMRVNYILTWAWTGAFLLMLVADILMIYAPGLPLWVGVGIAFAARNAAIYFTKWYPQYRRTRIAARAADATAAQ
jgi:hypothetical protein